jgi:mannose/fructose/N-acetylgalactosamine-specific phosphotransferase system component IID
MELQAQRGKKTYSTSSKKAQKAVEEQLHFFNRNNMPMLKIILIKL